MQTLSYGYKCPGSGDKGSVFWAALEFDITRLNAHSHNGTDSVKLTALSSAAYLQVLLAASWVASGANGLYRQLVTVPAGGNYDDYCITFRDSTSGHQYFLQVEKVTATTYYVYTNDNTLGLKVAYT